MSWDEFVIGGIGVPRFLLVDVNFCTNAYFNTDITGWTESSGGIFTRDATQQNALGEYMGKIEYTNDYEYVEYEYDMGTSITSKKFVLIFRAKSIADFNVAFYGSSEFGVTPLAHSNDINTYAVVGTATGQTGTVIKIRIYGTTVITESAELYFDDVFLSEAFNDFEMEQPQTSLLPAERITFGENFLWNGNIQQFNRRWRPGYFASWEYIDIEHEIYRQKIAAGQSVVCFPHNDVAFGFRAVWDKDFERRYFRGRFLGHAGIISLKGTQFITSLPTVQATTETLYLFDDELII